MKKIEEILKESNPSLMVFEHVGRQNSSVVKHLLDDLKNKYGDKLNVIRIDDTFDGKMKMRYHLVDYPSYILFKEGQELMRESGEKSIAQLEEMIKTAM